MYIIETKFVTKMSFDCAMLAGYSSACLFLWPYLTKVTQITIKPFPVETMVTAAVTLTFALSAQRVDFCVLMMPIFVNTSSRFMRSSVGKNER